MIVNKLFIIKLIVINNSREIALEFICMLSQILPSHQAIDAGVLSVMTSYSSVDGIPCTFNHYLLTQLLCNEWRFCGFVVSDLYSIEGIHESHFVAPTKECMRYRLSRQV